MSSRRVLAWVVLMIAGNDAGPTQRMTSNDAEDLEGSATGLLYNQQQALPVYYVQYTDHGSGRYYHAPDSVRYVVGGAAPVAHAVPETTPLLLHYASANDVTRNHGGTVDYGNVQPVHYVAAHVEAEPRAPYYVPGKVGPANGEGGTHNKIEEDHGEGESDEDEDGADGHEHRGHGNDGGVRGDYGHPVKATSFGSGYGKGESGGDGSSSSEEGGGKQFAGEEYSEQGEKGDKGYKNYHEFSKGENGVHDNEHRQGHYSNEGGQKKGHVDEAEEHGSHHEAEKGSKGSDYGRSSHHDKGEKTNGFHNKYHKDEYKKETDFYDNEHEKGYFNKYEDFDESYKEVEGDFKKGGHESSGHDQQNRGKKGHYDEGHHDSQDQGHAAEEGEKSYYANHANYGVQKDSNSANAHKFRKDSGHH